MSSRAPAPYLETQSIAAKAILRGLTALALEPIRKQSAVAMLESAFPSDRFAVMLVKAATAPHKTTTETALLQSVTTTLLSSVAPKAAAVKLFAKCARVDLTGMYQLIVPNASNVPDPIFIAEGAPMPIVTADINSTIIGPVRKILIGATVSGELEFAAFESAVTIIGRLLAQKTGPALNAQVFGSGAADATAPAGLLNGVSDSGAAQGGGAAAMVADLATLADVIEAAGGDPDTMMFFAQGKDAMRLRYLAGPSFTNPVISCAELAAGQLVGIAPEHIASAFDGLPTIETSRAAVLHYDDTTPLDISTTAVASTVVSSFQNDLIAVKVRTKAAYGKLIDGAIAKIESITW